MTAAPLQYSDIFSKDNKDLVCTDKLQLKISTGDAQPGLDKFVTMLIHQMLEKDHFLF